MQMLPRQTDQLMRVCLPRAQASCLKLLLRAFRKSAAVNASRKTDCLQHVKHGIQMLWSFTFKYRTARVNGAVGCVSD